MHQVLKDMRIIRIRKKYDLWVLLYTGRNTFSYSFSLILGTLEDNIQLELSDPGPGKIKRINKNKNFKFYADFPCFSGWEKRSTWWFCWQKRLTGSFQLRKTVLMGRSPAMVLNWLHLRITREPLKIEIEIPSAHQETLILLATDKAYGAEFIKVPLSDSNEQPELKATLLEEGWIEKSKLLCLIKLWEFLDWSWWIEKEELGITELDTERIQTKGFKKEN